MSWKTENSLKRIFNVFKRSKDKIYKEDIEALKYLNTELEIKLKTYVNDNLLYAKLLCYILNQKLHESNNIKTAIKLSNDVIKEPLDYHIKLLAKNLNDIEKYNFLSSLGIDFSSDDNDFKILKMHEQEILKKLEQEWTFKNVEDSFYNTANDFLRNEDNYI